MTQEIYTELAEMSDAEKLIYAERLESIAREVRQLVALPSLPQKQHEYLLYQIAPPLLYGLSLWVN